VRDFMHDDVMRKTSEDGLTGKIAPGIHGVGAKITEQDSLGRG